MCFGGGAPKVSTPAPAPQMANAAVQAAEEEERRRRRSAASNTILTGPQGVQQAPLAQKSLLGS